MSCDVLEEAELLHQIADGCFLRLKELQLACTAVTVIPEESQNPISANAEHRRGAVDHLKKVLDCAQAAGAETLCGPYYQPLGEFSGVGATEEEKAHGAEVHRKVADYAQQAGVVMAIESLNRFEAYFLNTKTTKNTRQPGDFLKAENLRLGQKRIIFPEDLGRHAVATTEVAPVRHRDPEIAKWSLHGVNGRLHTETLA